MKIAREIEEKVKDIQCDYVVLNSETMDKLLFELIKDHDLDGADAITVLEYTGVLPLVNLYQRESMIFAIRCGS